MLEIKINCYPDDAMNHSQCQRNPCHDRMDFERNAMSFMDEGSKCRCRRKCYECKDSQIHCERSPEDKKVSKFGNHREENE